MTDGQARALYAIAQVMDFTGTPQDKHRQFLSLVTGGRTQHESGVTFTEASNAIDRYGRKRRPVKEQQEEPSDEEPF